MYLNNQPLGPIVPCVRVGTPARTWNTMKVLKSQETTVALNLAMGQLLSYIILKMLSHITSRKGIIYWNLQWDFPPGWVSYFTPRDEKKLFSLRWDPIILLQAWPTETDYTWNDTHHERGEKVRTWSGICHQVHLLVPDSTASSRQQAWSYSQSCSYIDI